MEHPETELEVFSPLSIQEYIRLMTAAHYINLGADSGAARFSIAPENFAKMDSEPLKGYFYVIRNLSGILRGKVIL